MVHFFHHGYEQALEHDVPARPYQPTSGVGIGSRALIDWKTVPSAT